MNERKVLIITYAWPPAEGVGLLRALKFAKYLPEYGWQPVIMTVKHAFREAAAGQNFGKDMKVFRTDYRDVLADVKRFALGGKEPIGQGPGVTCITVESSPRKSKGPSLARELIAMPDEQAGWLRYGVSDGKKIIDRERVDLIFSTSPPETAHLIGRALKRYSRIPWVADLRDLWADDHFRQRPMLKKAILKVMERMNLREADAVTTVSEPWAGSLRSFLAGNRVKVVENGFDEEDFSRLGYNGNEKFTITYTGKLHKVHQPLDIFFRTLKGLIDEGLIDRGRVAVKFNVFGFDSPDIPALAGCHGIGDIVSCSGRVSYNESLAMQRASDALLFVQWQGRGGDGWYSAKLYDYIGARRPILALVNKESVAEALINSTSSGVAAHDEASLKNGLLALYREYEKSGRVHYGGREEEILKQTRKARAQKLAAIFDSLVRAR